MRDIRTQSDEPQERSIRNVQVTHRRPHHAAAEEHHEPAMPRLPRRRGSRRLWLWGGVVVVVCAVAGMLISTVFAGASVVISPRAETVTLPATIQAQLNAPVGVLAYQNVSVTKSATQTAPATGTAHVSRAATGLIDITNTYSSAPQRLIANTRFAATDGKIYRVRDSVTVPGMAGGKPGMVTATIYADSPGPAYNKTGPTNFTIPGFKGDPRYTKFSATAQGAISGGFIGDEPAVAPSDLAAAKSALQKQLDQEVRTAAAGQIPEGFVAIPGTLSVTFSDITQTSGSDNTATLTQSATALGAIVRQGDLATAIARKTVSNYTGEALAFGDVSHMNATATTTSKNATAISINLSGQAQLIWQFDPNAVKQALLGKDKSAFETTVKTMGPSITKATASIRPFWGGHIPQGSEQNLDYRLPA